MSKERHPFEKLFGEVLNLINDIEEKGKTREQKELGDSFKDGLRRIQEYTKKLRKLNQAEAAKLTEAQKKQETEEIGLSEKKKKRFLESLRKLKKELSFERDKAGLRQQILEDYEKGRIPETKPSGGKKQTNKSGKKKGKKALRARAQKKFKKIGGKDDWLPL